MARFCEVGCVSLVLVLQLVAQPAIAEEAPVQYQYSEEWSVVSAPPPTGPYRSVNIDPRVPGAGAVTPIPMNMPPPLDAVAENPADTVAEAPEAAAADQALEPAITTAEESTAAVAEVPEVLPVADQAQETAAALSEEAMRYPPAAGIPAPLPETIAPLEAASDALQQYPGSRLPAPGYYGRSMRQPPTFHYPAPMRYPRQSGYPGYRNMPPFGYYSPPAFSQEPEVPPPPVYERQRGYGDLR
jgi:hypothetical protein